MISEGAVAGPTLFTMTRDVEEPLRVKLTAGVSSENDVGAAGFAAPVTLVVSYAGAYEKPADASSMTVGYVVWL